MFTATGDIEIPLEDFYAWVHQYLPIDPKMICDGAVRFGKPHYEADNGTIRIDFAVGSDSDPLDWKDVPYFLSHLPKQR